MGAPHAFLTRSIRPPLNRLPLTPESMTRRITEDKRSLWQRIKRFAMTDVGALVRGLNADDIENMERVLLEADFGVPATMELVEALELGVRDGKLRNEADLREALVTRLAAMLEAPGEPGAIARAVQGPTVVLVPGSL